MDAFQRRGGRKRILWRCSEKRGAMENEEWPEALAASQNRMTERGSQSRGRACGFLRCQSIR